MLTLAGVVFIPLGIILFIIKPKWLYVLAIFFIPFSATAILNFSSSGSEVLLFFGILWVLSIFQRIFINGNILIPMSQIEDITLLLIFLLICITSIMTPMLLSGKFQIASHTLNLSFLSTPLTLTGANIKQLLYLAFGIALAIMVAIKNYQFNQLFLSLKIYVVSGFFVSLWGWLQFILFKLNISYPTFIFNSNFTRTYTAVLKGVNTTRITSVAVEPSICAQYLLSVFSILLIFILFKKKLFSWIFDRLALISIFLILLLSTSSTSYIGICFLAFITLFVLFMVGKLRHSHIMFFVFSLIFVFLIYLLVPKINLIVNNIFLNKVNTYSGLERYYTIKNAWSYFLKYPFTGLGFGSVVSHDLIVNILANTGIIGLIAFITIIFHRFMCFILVLRRFKLCMNIEFIAAISLGVSFLMLIFTEMFTGFHYIFGHFWFILGTYIAATSITLKPSKKNEDLSK